MARNASVSIENNFVGGLVTDSTGLNFPENACSDVANIVFDKSGAFRRRLGFDYETSHTERVITTTGNAITSYVWRAAAGDGDNQLVVIQVGTSLDFYKTGQANLSDEYLSSIDLDDFHPSAAANADVECQFASGLGYLFVASPELESFYVSYDPSDDSLTATEITLRIRDFEGVDDGLETDERPNALADLHEYNLFNQGWDVGTLNTVGGTTTDPVDYFNTEVGDFPSNADVWWYYKVAAGDYAPADANFFPGNSPAPKGHYILPYYDQDRTAASGIAAMPETTSGTQRCGAIAFFTGRVWYAGCAAEKYSNRILFSQIIERDAQIGECYQQNDPTTEEIFDILPSDGGTLTIPDAGTIIKLVPMESALLVFATNGVWKIQGSEGVGFRANDFSVSKMSAVPVSSANSFVEINGAPSWWNIDGIYTVAPDQTLGDLKVQSLTEGKISDYYDSIPFLSRTYARGCYDPVAKEVHWLFRSTAPSTVAQRYAFDRVLTLNVQNGAFSVWTVDITAVVLHAVQSVENTPTSTSSQFHYYVSEVTGGGSTFALVQDDDYVDWATTSSTNYDSYLTTGYKIRGEAQRKFQPTYVYIFSDNENSGPTVLDIQGRWGFATDGSTGRWSGTQRLTYDGGNYSYEYRRVKIRGHGIVLQLRIDSVDGEPMSLIGWSIFETGNAQV